MCRGRRAETDDAIVVEKRLNHLICMVYGSYENINITTPEDLVMSLLFLKRKKIVKRMYEEGHLIGNHTYRHVDLSKISGREAEKEIKTTDEAIKKITGHETEFIRPPFGAMPEGEEDPDKIYVKWTVDSLDWVTKDTEKIVEKVTADTKEGDVILMHDCYGESVEAALQIVDIMEKQGYEFVTADELIIN